MSFDVMVPFRRVLEEVSADNEVRVVVLTGYGDAFCSGADLEDSGTIPNIGGLTVTSIAQRSMEILQDVVMSLRRMHQPVIAAVNGPAIGGGFCLALACDIRVASSNAYFRAAGINNGLTAAELGLSFLLPRAVGSSRAAEIMLTGRDVTADEAAAIGLVSEVVESQMLIDNCLATAERIAQYSRIGVELTKRLLSSSMEAGSLTSHMDHEGTSQLYVRLTTRNFEEAIASRKAKRDPVFED